jgi:hypothetical protein
VVQVDDDGGQVSDIEADRVGEEQQLDDRHDEDDREQPRVAPDVDELLAHHGADPDSCAAHRPASARTAKAVSMSTRVGVTRTVGNPAARKWVVMSPLDARKRALPEHSDDLAEDVG